MSDCAVGRVPHIFGNFSSGKSLEGGFTDEMGGGLRKHYLNFRLIFDKQTDELTRFISSNASGNAQKYFFAF